MIAIIKLNNAVYSNKCLFVISGRRITVDHYREGVMVKRLMEDSSVTENELQEYKKDLVFINLRINKLNVCMFSKFAPAI